MSVRCQSRRSVLRSRGDRRPKRSHVRSGPTTEVTDSRIFFASLVSEPGAQLVLIFEAAAALGCFARLGSFRMTTRFTFFTSDPACLEPRLCAAYSWPSTGATCGGSLPRYGRPIPNSFPSASTHFQSFSEEAHRWSRVPPWTLTISAQAHAHSHRGSSRHGTTCCSPP